MGILLPQHLLSANGESVAKPPTASQSLCPNKLSSPLLLASKETRFYKGRHNVHVAFWVPHCSDKGTKCSNKETLEALERSQDVPRNVVMPTPD